MRKIACAARDIKSSIVPIERTKKTALKNHLKWITTVDAEQYTG